MEKSSDSYARKLIAAAQRAIDDSHDYEPDVRWRQLKVLQSIAYSLLSAVVIIVDLDEEEKMYGE